MVETINTNLKIEISKEDEIIFENLANNEWLWL